MADKYKITKEEIFNQYPYDEDFEKSTESRAEETTLMLNRIASIGYKHKQELGLIQSKEFDFVGTQEEKTYRIDEGRASKTLRETQEKTPEME